MDENYVMSTSVLQYLEEIRTFMKENNTIRPDENFDLFAVSKSPYEDNTTISIKCSSIENEEVDVDNKEENKDYDINSNINSIDSKENKQNEDLTFKKPKSTNKERAKKARQRKKKYYEELEKRAEYLEKKVSDLSNELEFCKQKIRVYEGQRSSLVPNSDVCIKTWLIDDCLKHIKTIPDSTEFMKTVHQITDSYGPFGEEKIKILDYAFESIIENMLCGGTKLLLYIINKDIPQTPTEFENYCKLKKFEKFDKYPNPFVRNFNIF